MLPRYVMVGVPVALPRPAFYAHPDPVITAIEFMGITSIAHYLGYPCDRYRRRGYGGQERAAASCAREGQALWPPEC